MGQAGDYDVRKPVMRKCVEDRMNLNWCSGLRLQKKDVEEGTDM